jgi:hypothetical protein
MRPARGSPSVHPRSSWVWPARWPSGTQTAGSDAVGTRCRKRCWDERLARISAVMATALGSAGAAPASDVECRLTNLGTLGGTLCPGFYPGNNGGFSTGLIEAGAAFVWENGVVTSRAPVLGGFSSASEIDGGGMGKWSI